MKKKKNPLLAWPVWRLWAKLVFKNACQTSASDTTFWSELELYHQCWQLMIFEHKLGDWKEEKKRACYLTLTLFLCACRLRPNRLLLGMQQHFSAGGKAVVHLLHSLILRPFIVGHEALCHTDKSSSASSHQNSSSNDLERTLLLSLPIKNTV